MKKIKVIHLVEYLYLGGIERLLEQLALNFSKDVELIFYTYETEELKGIGKIIQNHGFKVITFKKKAGTDFDLVKDLYRVIKDLKIDVVHTHDFGPMEYALFIKLRFPFLKLIHTQHTMHHFTIKRHYRYFFQLVSYFYSSLISVSKFVQDLIKTECPLTNPFILKTIYNGVDTSLYIPKNDGREFEKLKIVSVARMSPEKNLDYLFRTCKKLKENNIPFELHHAGTAKKVETIDGIKNYLKENDLENDVILHGYVDDTSKILNMADIFVSTSKREGHPVALLEAMSCEKYCVVTNILPHTETVGDAVRIYNFNDEDGLFLELKKIYTDNINIYNNNKLRKIVEDRFSIHQMVNEYRALYE